MDVRLHRVEGSCIPEDAHDVCLKGLWMHQVPLGSPDVLFNSGEADGLFDDVKVLTVLNFLPEWFDEVLALIFVDHDAKDLIEEVTS